MVKVFGIALIVFALGIAIIPQYTACQYQGKSLALANGKTTPMKCHWTAQAEIGAAIPLAAVGVMSLTSRRRETKRSLYVMGIALGALAMALPTSLIGVCSSQMPCNLIMKPSMLGIGSLAVAGCIVGVVATTLRRNTEKTRQGEDNKKG